MPPQKPSARSLASLLVAQAQVTFNCSAANLALFALVQFPGVLPDTDKDAIKALLRALLVAPLIAFAPLAGWVNDRFSKSVVFRVSLAAQCLILTLLAAALWLHLMWAAVGCALLLALQTTVFAPAKRAILMELVAPAGLSRAVGLMEMLSVTAMLLGGFGGARLFDHWTAAAADPWHGALLTTLVLIGSSAASWAVFQLVERTPPQSAERFSPWLFVRHGPQLLELWRARPILRATFGIMFFYGLGAYVYLLALQIGADAFDNGVGSVSRTGLMLLVLGAGTLLGNLAAGILSRRAVELGLIPVGGVLLAGALVALGVTVEKRAWPSMSGWRWLDLPPVCFSCRCTPSFSRRRGTTGAAGFWRASGCWTAWPDWWAAACSF